MTSYINQRHVKSLVVNDFTMGSGGSQCRLGASLHWQKMHPVASQTAFRPQTHWIYHTHLSDWTEMNGTTLARMAFHGPTVSSSVLQTEAIPALCTLLTPPAPPSISTSPSVSSTVVSNLKLSMRLIGALLLGSSWWNSVIFQQYQLPDGVGCK